MVTYEVAFTENELKSAIVRFPLIVDPQTRAIDVITQMSNIRAVCPASKTPDNQLEDLHQQARSSCTLIVDGKEIVGILTESDVVRLIAQKVSLDKLAICEVMTDSIVTLKESAFTDLFFALNKLQQHQIRHLPVLDNQDQVVGLLTHETLQHILRPVDLLRQRLVAEVINTDVICAFADMTMLTITRLMAEHQISSVVIVQEHLGRQQQILQIPVGIVTERDIVQFQALGLDLEAYQAQSVMSGLIFAVSLNDSLWIVHQLMQERWTRHIAVTGSQGELLGIVTQTIILQALNPWEIYKLAKTLENKVLQLEAEKIELLQDRTVELEQQVDSRTSEIKAMAEREQLVAKIASEISASLNLQDILTTTVQEVRSLLSCDYVAIWQSQPADKALVIAESIASGNFSYLGKHLKDRCFAEHWLELYSNGRIRVIPDINKTEMSDCHRELLESLQIKAKILIPIMERETLWGWLNVIERHSPREWQAEEVKLLQQLATHLAIAIQQATAYQKLESELAERQKAEMRMQESEQRFRQLAENIHQVFYLRDLQNSQILYISPSYETIWGRSCQSLYEDSMSYRNVIHPEDQEVVLNAYNHQLLGHNTEYQYRIIHSDKTIHWILDRGFPIRDQSGLVYRVCGLAEDITKRKLTDITLLEVQESLHQLNQSLEARVEERTQKLQQQEAILSDLFDNATDLIQSVSIEGQILFVNSAWKETLGYTDKEVMELSIFQIIHPDCRSEFQKIMQNLLEGSTFMGIETKFLTKEGREIIVEGNINCRFENGQPVATRGIFQNITDRKRAEIQLQQTNEQLAASNEELARATRLKDEFLANMSHELRTPLNAILGMTEGLLDQVFGIINEQQQRALQTVDRSGTHLLELINDILDLAKIESGNIELNCHPSAINQLCLSSITFIKQLALQKRIHIEVSIQPELPVILLDERRIRQVLINLLNNAVKFTLEGGYITLKVTRERGLPEESEFLGDFIRIKVIDTGIGIAPQNINKLFQPFIQIDSALNRQYAGTGLGLSLVKRIIEMHGGRVNVSSEVGVGSCFSFDLPCGNFSQISPKLAKQTPDHLSTMIDEMPRRSPLILLAEDNEANISTISSYLKAKGYNIILAKNGQEAIEITKREVPDLILMDIQMAVVDGLEAIKLIRSERQFSEIPIIALTALAMAGDRERCLAAGANEYLTKPVKLKQLTTTIQEFLNNTEP